MDDEVLARFATLVGVVHAGIDERRLDPVAIDRLRRLVGVFLDDREQVPEQASLGRRQLGPVDGLVRLGMLYPINGRTCGGDPVAATASGRAVSAAAAQSLTGSFALLRNLRPSSYRCS
jgi:hypothetical protein